VTHRSRQGARLARRENFGISAICRGFYNATRLEALAAECHRIYDSGHKVGGRNGLGLGQSRVVAGKDSKMFRAPRPVFQAPAGHV